MDIVIIHDLSLVNPSPPKKTEVLGKGWQLRVSKYCFLFVCVCFVFFGFLDVFFWFSHWDHPREFFKILFLVEFYIRLHWRMLQVDHGGMTIYIYMYTYG